jgi:hypothetical protein
MSEPDDAIGGYHAYATALADDAGLGGPWVQRFVGALALLADGALETAKQAVKLRFAGVCPADALDANGATFGTPRYPRESDARYRARLGSKWQSHEESGSRYGLERAFAAVGLGVDIFEQ